MPLKIKDKNAQIVVRTVYRIGKNILLLVSTITSSLEMLVRSFLSCKNLTVKWMFIAMFKINIRAMKFDEITVTFHPTKPKNPTIRMTETVHPINGIITHFMFLKSSKV